jgi:hypothetical protein
MNVKNARRKSIYFVSLLFSSIINIYSELTTPISKRRGLNKMIGNVPEIYENTNGKKGYLLYIPLMFWFCRNYNMALPIIALDNSDVKINVEFNQLDDCLILSPSHYIIIEEDGSIKRYNYNSIEGLPYYITCETPDEVVMKHDSLLHKAIELPKELKPTMVLKSINPNLANLNYYNGVAIAAEINPNKNTPKPTANFHGGKSITEELIYRFSGFYMPLFYLFSLTYN